MHERLSKGIIFGFIGNLLFVAFGIVCYFYYITYDAESTVSRVLEILAYTTEFSGFAILIYSSWLMFSAIRFRNLMKIGFSVYLVVEAVMMFLEINPFHLEFYKPYSLPLAIVHSVFSAAVCFAFLQLDPDKKELEFMIIVCVGIMLGGMFGNIMGIRIYFSIIANAVGFSVLFYSLKRMMQNEVIEVDCNGDSAFEARYSSSTIFSDDE